jgi:anti-sigma factor (TIGR02949 family)
MVDCQHVMKQLWEYVDGELPEEQVAALREHLAVCARCSPQYRFQLQFLRLLVRAASVPGPRPEFRRRLMTALSEAE